MCILSDTSLKELVIHEEKYEDAKRWFEKRDWSSINGKILIYPFNLGKLGPFSYDLSVGNEVFALRTQQKISLSEKREVIIEPDDVFLVLTQEYIGLPRDFAASVKPRFCFVREGIFQSMTKIDPTWFGKIAVAITNRSKNRFQLKRGQAFCTLIVHRLDKPCSRVLNLSESPALGNESVDYFLKTKKGILDS